MLSFFLQTACGLQLLFYALATNKDKQEKLAEELMTHMGPEGHLTESVLDKLVYLKACVQESLRWVSVSQKRGWAKV